MMPPLKLLHNKTHIVWKPNVCFIRAKSNYNLAATENTTPDLRMGKRRESVKVSQWGHQKIPRSECIILSVTPQPSLHLVARKKAKVVVVGTGGNSSAFCSFCQAPWRLWLQCFTPEWRHGQGWIGCTPTVCFSLAQNTFIRKLKSGKKLSVLVMATAIRSTSNVSLISFQISWGRNSISAANFILFSLEKFSKLGDYTTKCVWTFTPALPIYIYRHTIETHCMGCQDDVCYWNA